MFSSSLVNPCIDGAMNLQFKLTFKNALECGYYDARDTNQNRIRNGVRRELEKNLKSSSVNSNSHLNKTTFTQS